MAMLKILCILSVLLFAVSGFQYGPEFESYRPRRMTRHPPKLQPSLELEQPSSGRGRSMERPRPVRPGRPGRLPLSDFVRQRTELIVDALQQENYQAIAELLEDNTVIQYHSLLPHAGKYHGTLGFVELLQRGLRVFRPKDIKAEVESISEDRSTSIIKESFSGTFQSNGAQFQNGRRRAVLQFDPLDGNLRHVIIVDLESDQWVQLYLPRALKAVYNSTIEMLRFHSGMENSLEQYFSPDAVLRVNVFPQVMSAPEFKGFQAINQGYQELMQIAATSTCPFGVQIGEQIRQMDRRLPIKPRFSGFSMQLPAVRQPNDNVTQPLPDQPSLPDNRTQPVPEPRLPHNRTQPSVPEQPHQPDNRTQPIPDQPNRTDNQTGVMSKELFDTMRQIHCLMSIEILYADDTDVQLVKTIKGSEQAIFEHVTLNEKGLISVIELTFAEPLTSWDVYRVFKTQPTAAPQSHRRS